MELVGAKLTAVRLAARLPSVAVATGSSVGEAQLAPAPRAVKPVPAAAAAAFVPEMMLVTAAGETW